MYFTDVWGKSCQNFDAWITRETGADIEDMSLEYDMLEVAFWG